MEKKRVQFLMVILLVTALSQVFQSKRKVNKEKIKEEVESVVFSEDFHQKIQSIREKKDKNSSEKPIDQSDEYSGLLNRVKEALEIERKVLRTPDQKKKLESMFSDMKFIIRVKDFIQDTSRFTAGHLVENQKERMDGVKFISRAFQWSSNPKLESIKKITSDIILNKNLESIADLEYRRSVAADKAELFTNLKEVDYVYGLQIEESNKSKRIAKLIRFANNYYRLNNKGGSEK